MRIVIIGNSGSGKSTLARQLGERHDLATLDLDTVAWEPETVAVPRDEALAIADVRAFCSSNDGWVIEGCYGNLAATALSFRPQLLLLDPGVEACLENCRARPWEPHKYASREEQDAMLVTLLEWVRAYETRREDPGRRAHEALFDGYEGPKQHLTRRPGPGFQAAAD